MTNDRLRQWLQRLDGHSAGEREHAERVAVYAVATADKLGWPPLELERMRFAAALHDIGKLALPGTLLRQQSAPSGADVLELRKHAEAGADLLIDELDTESCEWIAAHHERWDGHGYPFGLFGSDIPYGARVIAVAETFDVLVNACKWRSALDERAGFHELRRCAGTQFDAEVVEAFSLVQPLIQPVRTKHHA